MASSRYTAILGGVAAAAVAYALLTLARRRRRAQRALTSLPPAHVISLPRFPAARAAVLRRAGLNDEVAPQPSTAKSAIATRHRYKWHEHSSPR